MVLPAAEADREAPAAMLLQIPMPEPVPHRRLIQTQAAAPARPLRIPLPLQSPIQLQSLILPQSLILLRSPILLQSLTLAVARQPDKKITVKKEMYRSSWHISFLYESYYESYK